MKDPIIEELWKIKDKMAKECGYNVDKLAKRLKENEKKQKKVRTIPKPGNFKK